MKLNVLLFGPYADAAEERAVELELPGRSDCTAADVLLELAERRPKLSDMLGAAMLAVNCTVARPDQRVREGDELAVIGLVSGG